MSERLGIEEGTQLARPIVEFYYKDDALNDPLVTEEHVIAFNWATQQDMDDMIALALRVNDFMSGMMMGVGIRLVDFKIEIGRVFARSWQLERRLYRGCVAPRRSAAQQWRRHRA